MIRLRLRSLVPSLALAAAVAAGLSAAAQSPWPGPAPDPAGWRRHEGAMDRGAMRHRHAQMIADWTAVLKLTPAQAQALSAAMQPPMRGDRPGGRDATPDGTLQRLDALQARIEDHEARMRARFGAMKAFYTALSPDQQKTFDAVSRLSHRGVRRGRMGMGGGDGPQPGWDGLSGRGGAGGPPPPPGE